ncbi:MAG TPA: hypothetical protein VJ833_03940 [Rhodanobacteraceae bacterium]|nr:hypothetical protein [Rhodanobacteraceae bacterium]
MRFDKSFIYLPRHPLLRGVVLFAGILLLIGFLAMGLLIGAAVIIAAALTMLVRRWLNGRSRRRADADVIEGEFTVIPPGPGAALPPAGDTSTTRTGW